MRVLVTGSGHSGSNLALETIDASGEFFRLPANGGEDRSLSPNSCLPADYLSKLCIGYNNKAMTKALIDGLIRNYPEMMFVFCLRNPIDNVLAMHKAYPTEHTFEYNIEQIEKVADFLDYFLKEYPDNLVMYNMNRTLVDFEGGTKELAFKLGIPVNDNMLRAYALMKNKVKLQKYKRVLDPKQANFLENREHCLGANFDQNIIKSTIEYFGLELSRWVHRPSYFWWLQTRVAT